MDTNQKTTSVPTNLQRKYVLWTNSKEEGTTFPVNIEAKNKKLQFFTLLDTGAICSCINYNTFRKLNVSMSQQEVPKVIGADSSDLGSMASVELTLNLGVNKVKQNFIICRELRRNIILGVDFDH